jgi:hypothetical protein
MRKLIGFIFFVLSSLIIIAVVYANIELFKTFFSDLEGEGLFVSIGLFIGVVWSMIYEPLVILLLSVIAMGKYSHR